MSEHDVEELLQEAVRTLGPDEHERAALLRALERPARWRRVRSALGGLALAAAGLIAILLLPSAVTLADVRAALLAQDWVRLEFDDGEVRWTSPTRDVRARVGPDGYVSYIDHRTGVRSSWFSADETIHQDDVGARDLGDDAWDVIVGPLRERAEGGGAGSPRWTVERATEQVDGRALVRFDSYRVDALHQRRLVAQLWADPNTRLPLRVREWRDLGRRVDPDVAWVEGTYTFPQEGPASIHDLGAPERLALAEVPAPEASPEVRAVLDEVLAARRAFPFAFRSAHWRVNTPDAELDVLYWIGRPRLQTLEDGFRREHHGSSRVWDARFFDLGARHPEHDVPRDAQGPERLAWAQGRTPVNTTVWDGERELTLRGPYPEFFVDTDPPTLRAFRTGGDLYANDHNFPHDIQWPDALLPADGSWERLEDAPAGLVGLRRTRGAARDDYFHDPARDHLCILRVRWSQGPAGWAPVEETRLEDLDRLPGGAWVARVKRVKRSHDELVFRQHVELLDPDEVDLARFDGDALIERARAQGWVIEGE